MSTPVDSEGLTHADSGSLGDDLDTGAPHSGIIDGDDHRRPGHVIFIAGSAGSLTSLQRLFTTLAPDIDAAVLITTHLPPTHRTLLPEILGRATLMPVRLARTGDRLERGRVYVAPPGYHQAYVRHGHFRLRPRPIHAPRGVTADPLFVSGARDLGAAAIAVVLSGANSNGAAGVRAIRAAGGKAVAQQPRDAAAPVMPAAAVSAGVDYCGCAEDIGRFLSGLCAPRPRVEEQ